MLHLFSSHIVCSLSKVCQSSKHCGLRTISHSIAFWGNNGAILHAGENHNFCGISRKAEGWCCRERMALLSQHHSVSAGLCLWDCVGEALCSA